MAVSIAQLAAALRVDNPNEPSVLGNLTHWLQAAREVVNQRAPNCPTTIADAATIKLAGYWFDQPIAARASGFASALTNSGALGMMGPWVVRRTAGDDAAGPIAPTPTPTPVVDTYGIASGWLLAGVNDAPTNPLNAAFTETSTGLMVPLPVASGTGYLLLWLEDREAPGNPVTIRDAVITRTNGNTIQMTFQTASPYAYSLDAKVGHIWVSGSVLVALSTILTDAVIEIGLQE